MFLFFVNKESRQKNSFFITGGDYNHIKNVLRMNKGENLLINCEGETSLCEISEFESESVICSILEENVKDTSLPIKIHLFQGLPKSDKMELIIQKAVELGVYSITPVEMRRCVVKLDQKKKGQKTERWQKIAESAAKQSKCSFIPTVNDCLSFSEALKMASELDLILIPYENKEGMLATKQALSKIKAGMSVGIFIGAEGGFEDSEIAAAQDIGGLTISLGQRILRTETAAITATGMCMLYAEMNLNEDK